MRLRGERDLLSLDPEVDRSLRSGPLLVLLGAGLWGTAGAAQALMGPDVPPLVVGALRTVVAGVVLGVLVVRGSRPFAALVSPGGTPRGRTGAMHLLAGVCVATYQGSFFIGVRSLGIAVGTIVAVGTSPFVAGALSLLVGDERPTRARVATTLLAVAGLVLLVRPEGGVVVDAVGVTAALGAGSAFGTFTVLARRLLGVGLRRIDTIAYPFLIGSVLLLPLLVTGIAGLEDPGALLRPGALLTVAWLGIGATAVGYLLFIAGLRHVTAVGATVLVLAEPLTAAVLGVLAFGERLGPVSAVGAVTVAAALLLTARRPAVAQSR